MLVVLHTRHILASGAAVVRKSVVNRMSDDHSTTGKSAPSLVLAAGRQIYYQRLLQLPSQSLLLQTVSAPRLSAS